MSNVQDEPMLSCLDSHEVDVKRKSGLCVPACRSRALSEVGPRGATTPLGPALERLMQGIDPCVRLLFVGRDASDPLGSLSFEVQAVSSRNPVQLAQGSLPASACYYVMLLKDHLLFILWCPEVSSKQKARVLDDARHAVLKDRVLQEVKAAISEPRLRLVQMEAREPQDILDGAERAGAGTSAQPGATVPVSIGLPERAAPPWRVRNKRMGSGGIDEMGKSSPEGQVRASRSGRVVSFSPGAL
eukprot:gnl/TRDRNA2_/TRDRNA2_135536_c2_seq2.p1 gnl/TRDRNA2_/TRDRNA2_135536_c2~~gnl/TRDRNA2_/TRDRNA2_135536_c2_seq2.p1  ORF type:complete len:274 (+),score=32.95 gnl/TRDRNA2_/TRDRNA2_135536_c2_seq2:93-824(+)